jgi:hypothetical protein
MRSSERDFWGARSNLPESFPANHATFWEIKVTKKLIMDPENFEIILDKNLYFNSLRPYCEAEKTG